MIDYFEGEGVKRESISRIVIRRILKYIKEAELGPGDKLPSEKTKGSRPTTCWKKPG